MASAVTEVCRENSNSISTYFKWKNKYGRMEASDLKRIRDLEDKNRQLKSYSDNIRSEPICAGNSEFRQAVVQSILSRQI